MSRKRRGIKFEPVAGITLDRLHAAKTAPIEALPTPFPTWNAICGEEGGGVGLAKSWLALIGGVTGTGKSFVAANIAAQSVRLGRKVGLVNFEMTQSAVATRFLAVLAGLSKRKLDAGNAFSSALWQQAKQHADRILEETGGVLVTNESSVFSIDDIRESYDQLSNAGVEQIIVDYAQLVTVPGVGGIFQRSEEVATSLRELTHEYKVQTIALSQFNREEAKAGKQPTIHGLMGGGIWEHAANQIWLIDHTLRARFGHGPGGVPQGEYTQLLGRKNRHGLAPVDLPIKWTYDTMRWDEYAPGTDQGDPFDQPLDSDIEITPAAPPEMKTKDGRRLSTDTKDLFEEGNHAQR